MKLAWVIRHISESLSAIQKPVLGISSTGVTAEPGVQQHQLNSTSLTATLQGTEWLHRFKLTASRDWHLACMHPHACTA